MTKRINVVDWQCPRCDHRQTFVGVDYIERLSVALAHFLEVHPEALEGPA